MKKIVRLTENDITRIVKRVIKENEDMGNPIKCAEKYVHFAFLTRKKGGDLPYWNDDVIPGKNDTAAYKRFIKYLKDVMDMPLYDDECEGVTFDDVAPFIRELYLKKIDKYYLGEAKGPLLLGDPDDSYDDDRDSDGDDNLSDKEFYMKYAGSEDLGWDVPHNKRRNRLRDIKGNYKKRKGSGMNEALGLLDKKNDLPGGIVKRKITDYASAKRYTMGTKISAEHLMRYIERGADVFMYTDRSSDKIFIDTLSKGVYDQLDRRIGEVTGNMDDWAMDYFDNESNLDEDLQLLGDPKSRGGNDEWDTPRSEKRINRELSDKDFYEKYKNKDLGWDVPHNQIRNRMGSIKSKGFKK
jgi:hypothetical protein